MSGLGKGGKGLGKGGTKGWKNGFEHNNLAISELKLQSFFSGSTWECVLLHEEMKIIY